MTRSGKIPGSSRGYGKLRTATYALLLVGIGLCATPAAAGCIYPSVPDLDAPPPNIYAPPALPDPSHPVGKTGNGTPASYPARGAHVVEIGCIVGPIPPLPPCSSARGDCFLPLNPPVPPQSAHHKDHHCSKEPLAVTGQKQKPPCDYHGSAFFNSVRTLSAQWS